MNERHEARREESRRAESYSDTEPFSRADRCVSCAATQGNAYGILTTVEADPTSRSTTKRNISEPRTRNASTPAQATKRILRALEGGEMIYCGCTTVPFLQISCADSGPCSRSTIIIGTLSSVGTMVITGLVAKLPRAQ